MDGKEYWELLQRAANDPNCAGVIRLNKRGGGGPEYNFHSALMANELRKGGIVGIMAKEEDQEVLNKWLWWLNTIQGVEVNVEVVRQHPPFEPLFIGWKLTLK